MLALVWTACARNAGQVVDETPPPSASPSPGPTVSASPSPPANPVQLEGPVNNREVRDLTGSGASVTFDMQLTDFAFVPTFVKVLPGANLRINVKNTAPLADHTFTSEAFALDRQLKPGESADMVVQLPQAGAFRFYCKLHADRGMQGAFYFNEGDQVSAVAITPLPSPGSRSTARGTRSSSTTRRSGTGGSATTGSTSSGTTQDDDLEIPDLRINEPDEDGNIEGSEGTEGARGTRGLPGASGAEGEPGGDPEAEDPEDP